MNIEDLRIRASAAGLLMSGGNGITAKQLQELNDLQARAELSAGGKAKPLTANMEATLAGLIAKRDAPPELGETGKRYIEKLWMKIMYGYDEPVVTDEMLKGNMCEQDSIALVSEVCDAGEFRRKNKRFYTDEFFSGTPDIVLNSQAVVEDIKSAWSLKTFFEKREVEPVYFAQGQVYMRLTGATKFRVHYCLVNTPPELVASEQKRYFWKYGGSENNRHYEDTAEQIQKNHTFDHIPIEQRVKTFEFEIDHAFIAELESKVILARAYFDTLKL